MAPRFEESSSTITEETPSLTSVQSDSYPFTWTDLSDEEKKERKRIYTAEGPWCVSPKASMLDLIVSSPGNVLMPSSFREVAEDIYKNFEVRHDDVFVVTYPKCGTTWTQEMVWQILHGVQLEVQESLLTRSPFLEMDSLQGTQKTAKAMARKNLEAAANMKGPRVIKTHLPIDMLPKDALNKAKIVFVARNPMDCCVSFFHHERLVPNQGFLGTFEQYAKLFRNGRNPMGDYWYHLKSGWNRRNHPNVKFIWFEDMKKNQREIIEESADFLGFHLTTKQVSQLEAHLHIDAFRNNKSVNMTSNYSEESTNGSFIRKGTVGDWKNHFTREIVEDWKVWIEQETFGTDIPIRMN